MVACLNWGRQDSRSCFHSAPPPCEVNAAGEEAEKRTDKLNGKDWRALILE